MTEIQWAREKPKQPEPPPIPEIVYNPERWKHRNFAIEYAKICKIHNRELSLDEWNSLVRFADWLDDNADYQWRLTNRGKFVLY